MKWRRKQFFIFFSKSLIVVCISGQLFSRINRILCVCVCVCVCRCVTYSGCHCNFVLQCSLMMTLRQLSSKTMLLQLVHFKNSCSRSSACQSVSFSLALLFVVPIVEPTTVARMFQFFLDSFLNSSFFCFVLFCLSQFLRQ